VKGLVFASWIQEQIIGRSPKKIFFFEIQEVLKLIPEFSAKRAAKGTGLKNCCLLRLFCLKQSSKSSFPYNIWVVKLMKATNWVF